MARLAGPRGRWGSRTAADHVRPAAARPGEPLLKAADLGVAAGPQPMLAGCRSRSRSGFRGLSGRGAGWLCLARLAGCGEGVPACPVERVPEREGDEERAAGHVAEAGGDDVPG